MWAQANHAGTTRLEDRDDPMLPFARPRRGPARPPPSGRSGGDLRRLRASPSVHAVPGLPAPGWTPGGGEEEAPRALVAELVEFSGAEAQRGVVAPWLSTSTWPCGNGSPPPSAPSDPGDGSTPTTPGPRCPPGLPTRWCSLRNPTGISHSPDEYAETGCPRHCPGGPVQELHFATVPWPRGEVAAGVLVRSRAPGSPTPRRAHPPEGAVRLGGLTVPGLANAHSHAFHRALRGVTQREKGSSGPGASRCTASPRRWIPTPISNSPGPRSWRWCWRGSPVSGSSTHAHPRRRAASRPERHGSRARPGRAGGGSADRVAGRLLPAAASAPRWAVSSCGSATGTRRGGPCGRNRSRSVIAARGTWRSAWPSLGPRGPRRAAAPGRRVSQRHAVPLHAHVSEQRAENPPAGEVRRHPGPVAERVRRAGSPLDRRARHAPVRRRRRAARRLP